MFDRPLLLAVGGVRNNDAGVVLSAVCVAAGRAMSPSSLVHAVLRVEQLMTAGTCGRSTPCFARAFHPDCFARSEPRSEKDKSPCMGGTTADAQPHMSTNDSFGEVPGPFDVALDVCVFHRLSSCGAYHDSSLVVFCLAPRKSARSGALMQCRMMHSYL